MIPFSRKLTDRNDSARPQQSKISENHRKWLCYIIALSAGPLWNPVKSVTVKNPPSNPSTVQAQAKFFQYRHLPTSEDFDQGHRLGSDRHFTERHERSRPSAGLFSAKVRWGDKKGGYGEHYWDLNHAGNSGNHGDDGYNSDSDDGSYHPRESPNDHYDDGPSDHSSYSNDDYDPEKSSYEENGRAKRAHPRARLERKSQKEKENEESDQRRNLRKQNGKKAEQLEAAPSHKVEDYSDEEEPEIYKKVPKKRQQYRQKEDYQPQEDKNQVVLVVKEKDDVSEPKQYAEPQPEVNHYVNYEGGAGVRQHQQPEASASAPRLFLEHSTGRVVDRSTGQAYILQPILNY
ncbi:uncharacterized protein LOC128670862 isoform X2 [Plodia interpunctella]|uniref:uncharacterized protein LOC128670862 isoform X2 n=1 Tax=Plodia interpunctella TaxID=58824 RepID=UPI002368A5E1|nr:uncharacterized protein LOC128670862 isoform X2 [Plodia interpunctella]